MMPIIRRGFAKFADARIARRSFAGMMFAIIRGNSAARFPSGAYKKTTPADRDESLNEIIRKSSRSRTVQTDSQIEFPPSVVSHYDTLFITVTVYLRKGI